MSSYDLVDWKAARDQCSPLDRYKFAEKPKALDYIFGRVLFLFIIFLFYYYYFFFVVVVFRLPMIVFLIYQPF